jgi:hypothetical protein
LNKLKIATNASIDFDTMMFVELLQLSVVQHVVVVAIPKTVIDDAAHVNEQALVLTVILPVVTAVF